jgi:hypothetical protein
MRENDAGNLIKDVEMSQWNSPVQVIFANNIYIKSCPPKSSLQSYASSPPDSIHHSYLWNLHQVLTSSAIVGDRQ